MAGLRIDEATRAAIAAGDLRGAVRAVQQANPSLKLEDLPSALKAVRQAVEGSRSGAAAATREAAADAAHAVKSAMPARPAPKRVPTVAPGDGGTMGAMRLLAIVTVGAVAAGLWWMARGG